MSELEKLRTAYFDKMIGAKTEAARDKAAKEMNKYSAAAQRRRRALFSLLQEEKIVIVDRAIIDLRYGTPRGWYPDSL